MMRLARMIWGATFLFVALFGAVPAVAEDLTLTKDCEEGFRQLIRMAQGGRLGDDVTNANVAVAGNKIRVELVGARAPVKVLLLTPKRSPQAVSRYFDVVAGEGATASDVGRVGTALDEVFVDDPFQILGLELSPGDPVPTLAEAWALSGWRGARRAFEQRMMVLAGLQYTVGVIVALAAGLLASLAVLWGSAIPER